VCSLYNEELLKGENHRLQLLELSGYLENYLWKHLSEDCCFEHIFSILMMVNEKFREGVPVFEALTADATKFQMFFKSVVQMSERFQVPLCAAENEQLVRQYTIYVHFLVNTFRSLEDPVVRNSTLKYLSLPIWGCLSEARLLEELNKVPQIKRHWEHLQSQASAAAAAATVEVASSSSKKEDASPPAKSQAKKKKVASKKSAEETAPVTASAPAPLVPPKAVDNSEKTWIFGLLTVYVRTIEEISSKAPETLSTKSISAVMRYLERFSEFILDLLSQLPTRRFLNTVLDDMHLLVRCRRASVLSHPDGKLLSQLVGMIDACIHFEVHDQTGRALSPQDMMTVQNSRIHRLQTLAFSNYKSILKDLVFSSSGELAKPEILKKHFQLLTTKQLTDVASKLGRMSESDLEVFGDAEQPNVPEESVVKSSVSLLSPVEFLEDSAQRSFVMDVLVDSLSSRMSQLEALNRLSLYPSEELLWDQYQVPLGNSFSSDRPLALPKLNLQFLTVHDYLLRNFELFRLESAFQIREDLIDSITRMGPRRGLKGNTLFGGWARMALPIASVSIDEISKPQLGETIPGHVHCTIEVDISRFSGVIKQEWEALRDHDIIFMVGIEDPQPEAAADLNEFKDEKTDITMGKNPKINKKAEKLLEDMNFPKNYGTSLTRSRFCFLHHVLSSVMIFQQLSLSYNTIVSGDHHVTT
jgi:intron-binding protein aquarius